jgi:hypothetical protein
MECHEDSLSHIKIPSMSTCLSPLMPLNIRNNCNPASDEITNFRSNRQCLVDFFSTTQENSLILLVVVLSPAFTLGIIYQVCVCYYYVGLGLVIL